MEFNIFLYTPRQLSTLEFASISLKIGDLIKKNQEKLS